MLGTHESERMAGLESLARQCAQVNGLRLHCRPRNSVPIDDGFRLALAALALIRHSHQKELRKHWTAPRRRPTLVLVLEKRSDGNALANRRFVLTQ